MKRLGIGEKIVCTFVRRLSRRNEECNAEARRAVPEWEGYLCTPAVFVRVANTGLGGYGTWKSVRRMEGSEFKEWGAADRDRPEEKKSEGRRVPIVAITAKA
jgi:hypothetical protein